MATRMYVCESVEHPSSLLMGLNEQRLQGQLCDVTVRVQGHLFKAHTNILASAMGYFRDLFLNPNKQVKKDIIEIPMIVNSIGFAKVLDFIYTSQLCLSQSSVMQVLCSACYLQIPYVVDKCQEFIVTHGHSSPQNTFPPLTDHRYYSDKATDSQECELINTPPSPGNQSTSTGNRDEQNGVNAGSPVVGVEENDNAEGNAGKAESLVLVKQENSTDTNRASRALMEISQQSRYSSDGNTQKSGSLKTLLQNEGNAEGDTIDHESLAEYFARNAAVNYNDGTVISAGNSVLGVTQASSPSTVENHLYSMTKNMRGSPSKDMMTSATSSVSQYLLAMKKEKPKKEYRCEYCNKLFGRQQHLKRHILTHTGERPYPCNLCEKRFRRSEHLKHHLVKHQQQEMDTAGGSGGAFVDFMGTGRKRPRKPVPSDAYGMSKMMLGTYNQQRSDNASTPDKLNEKDNMTRISSTVDNISQRLAIAASQSLATGSDQEQENRVDQTMQIYSTEVDSPIPVALNLSSKESPSSQMKITELSDDMTPSPAVGGTMEEGTAGTIDEANMEQYESPAPQSEDSPPSALDMSANSSIPVNGEMNNSVDAQLSNSEDSKPSPDQQNQPNGMSIDGFATSEVVTNDLKRLFAAMDE